MNSTPLSTGDFHSLQRRADSTNFDNNFRPHHQHDGIELAVGACDSTPDSSDCWMGSIWAPPSLLTIGGELDQCFQQQMDPRLEENRQHSGGNTTFCDVSFDQQTFPHLKRPAPISNEELQPKSMPVKKSLSHLAAIPPKHTNLQPQSSHQSAELIDIFRQQKQRGECRRLIVLKEPEEQHRARYASEGSRGAIKDRSGSSFCSIQLVGFYRPTRVELFAAERNCQHVGGGGGGGGAPAFVQHSQYKLIPVAGKSSTMTPCKRITAEDGSERLEIILRPENRMIGILDSIGIMKICSYNSSMGKRPKRRKRKAATGNELAEEDQRQLLHEETNQQNNVHIVARAFVPLVMCEGRATEDGGRDGEQQIARFEVLQAVTEPIRCVQQLGTPDVLKMSLESCSSNGGQELFIIGRNFDPKDTRVLFREYRTDGSLGWSAEATMDRRFLHQCHIVCTVPAYHNIYRNGTVSLTVICGSKQTHPINFLYSACEREDDDWRPPEYCSNIASTSMYSRTHQETILLQRPPTHILPAAHYGNKFETVQFYRNGADEMHGERRN